MNEKRVIEEAIEFQINTIGMSMGDGVPVRWVNKMVDKLTALFRTKDSPSVVP